MIENTLPEQASSRAEITCPSCGRFVGALTRCPYCGASVHKRLSIRIFRYAALLLGTVGLFFLYLMVRNREIPLVKISGITPTMNFAYVRVAGRVASDTRVYREGDRVQGLGFVVDDGTGEIAVRAYRAVARDLLSSNIFPRMGDRVTVAGSLSVSADDRILLRLQSPRQLHLEAVEPPSIHLADLSEDLLGKSVIVEGVVSRIMAPRPGSRAPWVIRLVDRSGSADLTFWEDVYAGLPQRDRLLLGAVLRVRASVSRHRGRLQLRVSRSEDLQFLEGDQARGVSRGVDYNARVGMRVMPTEVNSSLVGRVVSCSGVVDSLQRPRAGSRAPWRMRLTDGTGSVTVIFWDDVARHVRNLEELVGARVRVQGRVNAYRGRLQLKLEHSRSLMLIEPRRSSPEEAPLTVSEVTTDLIGRVVTLTGRLAGSRGIPGGVVYTLENETGSIPVVLWDRQVPGRLRDWMEQGLRVRITGTVKEYHGKLEVVPRTIHDIAKLP